MSLGRIALFSVLCFCFAAPALCGQKNPTSINFGCVAIHCPASFAKAALNPEFRKISACQKTCIPIYYNDTTVGKLHYQNCTTKCALTYESKAGDEFLSCAMKAKCVTFAKITGVVCPKPDPDPTTSLADLAGEWWQHYGKNPLWDCYPCQHIHSMQLIDSTEFCSQTVGPYGPVRSPCWAYNYSYDLYTETGTRYFGQQWQLPSSTPKGAPIDIFYTYMGSTHNETWYILKATPRFVVLVDCSYMSGWTNVGSIVWVRPNVELSPTEMDEIAAVYQQKLGWVFPDQFCHDRHGPSECSGPSAVPRPPPMRHFLRLPPQQKEQ